MIRQASGSLHQSLKSLIYVHNETGTYRFDTYLNVDQTNHYHCSKHLLSPLRRGSFWHTSVLCVQLDISPLQHCAIRRRYSFLDIFLWRGHLFLFISLLSSPLLPIFEIRNWWIYSCSFHIIANHSPKIAAFGNQLDYAGVVILMWGSTIPSVYYGLYCDPHLQKLYWSLFNDLYLHMRQRSVLDSAEIDTWSDRLVQVTILAAACLYTTVNPSFCQPKFRPYRAAMYTALGLSALICVTHGLAIHGWEIQNRRMSLNWMGLMATSNLIGAAAYALRVSLSSSFIGRLLTN